MSRKRKTVYHDSPAKIRELIRVEYDTRTVTTSLRLPIKLHAAVTRIARESDLSMQQLITLSIRQYCETYSRFEESED